MRPMQREYERIGNIGGEVVGMTIDTSALEHIMSVLTDLYSDTELAVIREYSTNARDSHIEAGTTEPILVNTPSALEPYLTVEDFGIGMNAEDIRRTYSRYGASTKRESDEVQGMLGLGCKSGLTHSESFTIQGTKDGWRILVSVERDERGAGSMTILSEEPTTERNGVKITIPSAPGEMESKAETFFAHWPKGSVLLNGIDPTGVKVLHRVNDDIYFTENSDYSYYLTGYVHMGGVMYPVPWHRYCDGRTRGQQLQLHIHVPIGSVHFTPSREALLFTPTTERVLREKLAEAQEIFIANVQARVDECKTHWEAADVAQAQQRVAEAIGAKGTANLTYKGAEIPASSVNRNDPFRTYGWKIKTKKSGDERRVLATGTLDRHIVLINYPNKTLTPSNLHRLNEWANGKDLVAAHLVNGTLTPDEKKWLNPANVADWTKTAGLLAAPKTDRTSNGDTVVGTYRASLPGTWFQSPYRGKTRQFEAVEVTELDGQKKICYTTGSDRGYYINAYDDHAREAQQRDESVLHDWTLVVLPSNRQKKFKRLFPKAIPMGEAYDKEVKAAANRLDKDLLYGWYLSNKCSHYWFSDDLDGVTDPNYVTQKRQWKKFRAADPAQQTAAERAVRQRWAEFADSVEPWTNKYPLLHESYYIQREPEAIRHIITYVNAVVAAGKE